jgi:hypothetical protein
VIELKTADAATVKMEDVFSIDGVTYQIASVITVNVALQYMRMLRTQGQEVALGWAIERVLGDDAYTALMNFDGLTPEQLAEVMDVVRIKLMGAVEGPKGK